MIANKVIYAILCQKVYFFNSTNITAPDWTVYVGQQSDCREPQTLKVKQNPLSIYQNVPI